MGCDVEKGLKDISAKDSLVVVAVRVPSRTKLTSSSEGRDVESDVWVRGEMCTSVDDLSEA